MTAPLKQQLYIGIMSGTSMDAIDAVVIDFAPQKAKIIASYSEKLSRELQAKLQNIVTKPSLSLATLGSVNQKLGKAYANCVHQLLNTAKLKASQIIAIGNHGQTVFHQSGGKYPFSMQLGDNNLLAELCNINTIGDFRNRDIAAGGEGAPLASLFHQYLFKDLGNSVVLNIGGIANISIVHNDNCYGFDTGPGNTLMDNICRLRTEFSYDSQGKIAASGKIKQKLLQQLLSDNYFAQSPPKSTGREYFNLNWLGKYVACEQIELADLLATLSALTATTIADAISKHAAFAKKIIICGGGGKNKHLIQQIDARLAQPIHFSSEFGVDEQLVEAAAFAYLAYCHINKIAGNLPAVTGAKHPRILGALYPKNI